MSLARRFGGTFLGAALTVTGWVALGVTDFGPRLLVAFAGFLVGHGIVRLALGPPPPTSPSSGSSGAKSTPSTSRSLGWGLFGGLVLGTAVFGCVLFLLLRRNAHRREAEARLEANRASAVADATATASTNVDQPFLRVHIGSSEIRVDGAPVEKGAIPTLARQAKQKNPRVHALLGTDPDARYPVIVEVMDRLHEGGIDDIQFEEPEKKSP